MAYANAQKQKEAARRGYLRHKNRFRARHAQRRLQLKKFVDSLKSKCACGETRKYCLDFHHLSGKIKTISQLVGDTTSFDKIRAEIDKCKVVCGNCHHKEHRTQIKDGTTWRNFSARRVKKRCWFVDFISRSKCVTCGEHDSRCLEFHHVREKRHKISYLLTSGHSLDYLIEEIGRCEILCVNCHRDRHYGGYGVVDCTSDCGSESAGS